MRLNASGLQLEILKAEYTSPTILPIVLQSTRDYFYDIFESAKSEHFFKLNEKTGYQDTALSNATLVFSKLSSKNNDEGLPACWHGTLRFEAHHFEFLGIASGL